MSPLQIIKHYENKKLDLVADGVLQVIKEINEPCTTQTIVLKCHKDKVASHATVYHKLMLLKDLGLIASHRHPTDHDTRKKWIRITSKGEKHLEGWMK